MDKKHTAGGFPALLYKNVNTRLYDKNMDSMTKSSFLGQEKIIKNTDFKRTLTL